jgi:hypothetical protein
MAATTDQLTSLSQDGYFRQRFRALMLLEAGGVLAESTSTTNHSARCTFAITLLTTPSKCDQYSDWICSRTNLTGSTVTYDFSRKATVTDATDGAIRSQIATDWNVLSGLIP